MNRATAVTLLQHRWLLTGEEKRDQLTRRTVALQSESYNELSLHVSRQRGKESSNTIPNQGNNMTSPLSQQVGDGKQKTGVENRSTRIDNEPNRSSRRRTVFPAENTGNFPVVERQIGHEEEVERQAHIQRVLIKERSKGSNGSQLIIDADEEIERIMDRDNNDNKQHKDKERGKDKIEGIGKEKEKERRSSTSGRKENKDKSKQEKIDKDKDMDKDKQDIQEHTSGQHHQYDIEQLHDTEASSLKNESLSDDKTVFNTTVPATVTTTITAATATSTTSTPSTAPLIGMKCKSELSEKLSDRISLKPSCDSDNSPRSAQVDLQFDGSGDVDVDAESFKPMELK